MGAGGLPPACLGTWVNPWGALHKPGWDPWLLRAPAPPSTHSLVHRAGRQLQRLCEARSCRCHEHPGPSFRWTHSDPRLLPLGIPGTGGELLPAPAFMGTAGAFWKLPGYLCLILQPPGEQDSSGPRRKRPRE